MAHVADHLSVSALEQQDRSCTDVTAARHLQTIWLLAKGHEIAEVAATVSDAQRWVERLLARYNAQGPQALGDLRRRNGTSPSVLRVCPGTSCGIAEPSQHEADRGKAEEGERLAIEGLPILGQSTAAVQPSYGAFDNPALR